MQAQAQAQNPPPQPPAPIDPPRAQMPPPPAPVQQQAAMEASDVEPLYKNKWVLGTVLAGLVGTALVIQMRGKRYG